MEASQGEISPHTMDVLNDSITNLQIWQQSPKLEEVKILALYLVTGTVPKRSLGRIWQFRRCGAE